MLVWAAFVAFVLLLLALDLVPGPGFVLVIAGVSMMNFPGRRRLLLRFLRMPWLLKPINRLRELFGQARPDSTPTMHSLKG